MLKIEKTQRGSVPVVKMSGSIDESTDFARLLGNFDELIVVAREVARINSVGIKNWVKYFQALAAKGCRLFVEECSPALVEHLNTIANFFPGEVRSIAVPFFCNQCKRDLQEIFTVEKIRSNPSRVAPISCPHCGNPAAEFDDMPEDYFFFALRNK